MKTVCSIDWFSVTSPTQQDEVSPRTITETFVEKKGRLGYKVSRIFENGIVQLYSDDRPEVHVIYSGSTLSKIAHLISIKELVQWHLVAGHRTSRIDTAVDVFDSGAEVQEFSKLWSRGNIKTHAKSAILISDPRNETGDTFYVGSLKKRRKLLRIYDKAKEQKIDKDWLRFEMQWGAGSGRNAAKQLAFSSHLPSTIKAQMLGFCDFRHKVWKAVFAEIDKMKVSHDVPKGIPATIQWLYDSVVPALVRQEAETPGITNAIAQIVAGMIEDNDRMEKRKLTTF